MRCIYNSVGSFVGCKNSELKSNHRIYLICYMNLSAHSFDSNSESDDNSVKTQRLELGLLGIRRDGNKHHNSGPDRTG